jgi:hypothetical protein
MQYRVANINDLENLAKLHAESWRKTYRGIFSDEFLDNDVWEERKSSWASRLSSPKNNQHVLIATDNNEICENGVRVNLTPTLQFASFL